MECEERVKKASLRGWEEESREKAEFPGQGQDGKLQSIMFQGWPVSSKLAKEGMVPGPWEDS